MHYPPDIIEKIAEVDIRTISFYSSLAKVLLEQALKVAEFVKSKTNNASLPDRLQPGGG